jgi:hypothetical protein
MEKTSEQKCSNCRYRKRGQLRYPCSTGSYQLKFSKRCFEWKPTVYDRIVEIVKWSISKGGKS